MKKIITTKTFHQAFTLIELLISVVIISFAIVYVLKLYSANKEQIVYISERNKRSLEDSLYLTKNILKYHKETKSADDILVKYFQIKESKSREILQHNKRDIYIPEELHIMPPPDTPGPTAIANEIKIKDKHSSIYWHFKITSF